MLIIISITCLADSARVTIVDSDSDYINFCHIDVSIKFYANQLFIIHLPQGYDQGKAFLIGPGPMQSTARDFWTMVWEKKCYTIVMLGQLNESGEVIIC